MGSQDKSPNSRGSLQHVKIYRLNEDRNWDDQGTGHVTVYCMERSDDPVLVVVDEENETLLFHHISSDDIYQKPEAAVISWRDPELANELALSFPGATSCSYIWEQICNMQRNMQLRSLDNETFHNINSELRELPPVDLSTLPLILKIVESSIADQLRATELILHDQKFFGKLLELFKICEDLKNMDGLHFIFKIVRGIILLNNTHIFEKIFGDELIMDIIGCLEYDPEVPHTHHRKFLKEHVVFKEAIPIKDPEVLSRIHQTYKIGYLKDVILSRALDEGVVANLNSIINSNNAVVVTLLKDDKSFIKELFAGLKSPMTSIESKKILVNFVHEFCNSSKSLQLVHQHQLLRDLVSEGIFDIIADVLQNEDHKFVLIGTDILILFQSLDANILRSYVTRPENVLFGLLVKNMLTDYGDDMHCQFLEILRSLLESSSPGAQKENMAEIFYDQHLDQLIDVITSSCLPSCDGQTDSKSLNSNGGMRNQSRVKPEILLNICDLLCFCVLQHPSRIKCNFLHNNVIDKILYLMKRKEKYLVVGAVRFIRTIISCSDEHLMNHIAKNNLFKPIVDAFIASGNRYNLLNSVVLELFEYIRKENLKILLKYLIDTFWDVLAKFESLTSLHALKVKYEQLLESTDTARTTTSLGDRKRLDDRALEKEEEDYFNGDSDGEDSASAPVVSTKKGETRPGISLVNESSESNPSARTRGLVDYDDDDDDEDYRPPPPPKRLRDTSDEEVGLTDFRLKRKLVSKEPERLHRSSKARGVLASLCSTLSEAVLPGKKVGSASDVQQNTEKEKLSEARYENSSDNRKHGDESSPPLLPPKKSTTEMTVNGS